MSPPAACDLDAVLNALEGDRDLLSRMVQIFLEENPALLERTRHAIAGRDQLALGRLAHTMRGALANFAAHEAGGAARRLEVSAEQGDWNGVVAAHDDLEKQMHDVVSALTAFSAGPSR